MTDNNLPGNTIPLSHLAVCVNHDVPQCFNVEERVCPKCASECSWLVIPWGMARETVDIIETEKVLGHANTNRPNPDNRE